MSREEALESIRIGMEIAADLKEEGVQLAA